MARTADPDHAADHMIDGFWANSAAAWPATGFVSEHVTFSNGAGNVVTPNGAAGFPIVAGTTDFAALLVSGPMMISNGAEPAQWLLATQMAPDGRGIVANDPVTGWRVLLSYDPQTRTVGGVIGLYDPKRKGVLSLADVGGLTSDAGPMGLGIAYLEGFVAKTYIAVTVK